MTEAADQEATVVTEQLSPATAFSLVAHETRVEILESLRTADGGPLSFGEIREAVGVDDPGQCHYHVDRLTDRFVQKSEEGYRLSPAGWLIANTSLKPSPRISNAQSRTTLLSSVPRRNQTP